MFHSQQFICPLTLFQVLKCWFTRQPDLHKFTQHYHSIISSCRWYSPFILTNCINVRLVTHGRQVVWLYPGRGWSRLPRGFVLEYLILLFFLSPSENFYHFCCSHCEKQNPGSPSLETEVWFVSEASSISVLCRSLWKNPGERWDLDLQVLMKGVEWPGAAQKPPWTSWLKFLSQLSWEALFQSALRTKKKRLNLINYASNSVTLKMAWMSKVPRSLMLKNFYEWRYCLRTVLLQRSQVALSNSKRSRLGLQVTRANLNARDVHTGDLYLNKDILYNFFLM